VNDRIQALVDELSKCETPESRYKLLIKKGRDLPVLNPDQRDDKFLVEGCLSKAWLVPSFNDGIVKFYADSEAAIVKGIMAVLLDVYSGLSPQEIVDQDAKFLSDVGIVDHLSMNRRNGLSNFLKQIKLYATVFNSMPR